MFGFKEKIEPVDRKRSLHSIPAVNEDVSMITDRETGNITVCIKMKRSNSFLARFHPPVLEKKIELDEIGTFVIQQIDGKKPVIQIMESFIDKYKINRREAELIIVSFLKSLLQRRAISIGVID